MLVPKWLRGWWWLEAIVWFVAWPAQFVLLALAWRLFRQMDGLPEYEDAWEPINPTDDVSAAELEDDVRGMHIAWRHQGGSAVVPVEKWSDEQLEDVVTDLSGFLGELHDELAKRELSA